MQTGNSAVTEPWDLSASQERFLFVAFAFVALIFHWPWLIEGRPIHATDASWYFGPLLTDFQRALTHGKFPLWSDRLFSGHPLVAEAHLSLLHPLRILTLLIGGTHAQGLFLYIHTLIAALGTWAYLRSIGTSRLARALATWGFALSGFFSARLIHPNIYAGAALVPAAFWTVERFLTGEKGKSLRWSGALAALAGCQWLAGHPQIPILTAYFLILYTALRTWFFKDSERICIRPIPALLGVGGACGLGLALAAVQVIPLLTDVVNTQSERAGVISVSAEFASRGSLPPWGIFIFLTPAFYGTSGASDPGRYWLKYAGAQLGSWEVHAYPSALMGLLALFTILHRRNHPLVKTYIVLVLATLIFAFGKWGGVYWIVRYAPGLPRLRAPCRATFFTMTAMLPLAALGFDRLRSHGGTLLGFWRQFSKRVLVYLMCFWVVGAFALWFGGDSLKQNMLHIASDSTEKKIRTLTEQGLPPDADSTRFLKERAAQDSEKLFKEIQSSVGIKAVATATNLALLASALWLISGFIGCKEEKKQFHWALGLLALVAVDLLWFRATFGPHTADTTALRKPTLVANYIGSDEEILSLFSLDDGKGADWSEAKDQFAASLQAYWGINSPDGAISTNPASFWRLIEELKNNDLAGAERLRRAVAHEERLRILGVDAVIAGKDWGRAPWPLLTQTEHTSVWRIPAPMPRAFVSSLDSLDTPEWEEAFSAKLPNLKQRGLLSSFIDSKIGIVTPHFSPSPDEAHYAVTLTQAGTFVRTVRFTNGWEAHVNGKPTPLKQALGHFQSLRLEAGKYDLHFTYRPRSFKQGTLVSLGALFILIASLVGSFFYRQPAAETITEIRHRP